jgi:chromate reductase
MSFTMLGISGSLRKHSFNRFLLQAAQQLLPEGVEMKIADIGGLPLFNQDQERELPVVVTELKSAIRAADAIVLATPEYNYSTSGVLKNAIDWASRPYGESAWKGKPVAVMGATVGMLGTGRAQYHLRQMFVFLDMYPLNQPEVMIAGAPERFDAEGHLHHEPTRELIRKQMAALVSWAHRLDPGK